MKTNKKGLPGRLGPGNWPDTAQQQISIPDTEFPAFLRSGTGASEPVKIKKNALAQRLVAESCVFDFFAATWR